MYKSPYPEFSDLNGDTLLAVTIDDSPEWYCNEKVYIKTDKRCFKLFHGQD